MRAIVQRVMKASVTVGDELISSVGKGICVLVGISRDDTKQDMDYLIRKILNLRVFEDENDKRWTKSVMDKDYEILCVSQFTLYATMKGNKPDYHLSMGAEQSEAFYKEFIKQMGAAYVPDRIKEGSFGAMMQVHIQNDGPVTISLESPAKQDKGNGSKGKGKPKAQGKGNGGEDLGASSSSASLSSEVEDKCQINS